jgi:tRNA dimethylallyltransferase
VTRRVLFLVGPTGSGKTELSLLLARRLGLEIVSADSMLVYRGMDIGTAKPTRADRKGVPHHGIDLVSPRINYSVYAHRERALKAIETILGRGRVPLVVGGGGLYIGALWRGISPQPGGNRGLRRRLEREAKTKGLSFLYERLKKIDPRRAQAIHPHDERRIFRALEISEMTGKRPSEWHRERESLEDLGYDVLLFGIERERSELYERINARVIQMFRKGFLEEVKRLKRRGFSKTARQALGYREVLSYLDAGRDVPRGRRPSGPLTLEALISAVQRKTRQFAKRQLTWLRREKEIRRIPWAKEESCRSVCDKIIKELRRSED